MKSISIAVLFLLVFQISARPQSPGVIKMPRPGEVARIKITRDLPHFHSEKSLLKLLPCFYPVNGTYLEGAMKAAQWGAFELKGGRHIKWVAMSLQSILLSTDKGEQLFKLSTDCSTATQAKGRHGGQLKKAQDFGNLIVDANFELVLEKVGSNSNLYHARVYVTDGTRLDFNLSQSGYAGIRVISNGEQVEIKLNKESRDCSARSGCFESAEKFTVNPDSDIEVVIAFNGKDGTGIAVFDPFENSSRK